MTLDFPLVLGSSLAAYFVLSLPILHASLYSHSSPFFLSWACLKLILCSGACFLLLAWGSFSSFPSIFILSLSNGSQTLIFINPYITIYPSFLYFWMCDHAYETIFKKLRDHAVKNFFPPAFRSFPRELPCLSVFSDNYQLLMTHLQPRSHTGPPETCIHHPPDIFT